MARVNCPECGSEFVVPEQLARDPVLCPQCGKNIVPVSTPPPSEGAPPPRPPAGDSEVFEALYQAADYEERVGREGEYGVSEPEAGKGQKPASFPIAGRPGLRLREEAEEKPRGKGGLVLLVIFLVAILAAASYFSWKLFRKSSPPEEAAVTTPAQQTPPDESGVPWTPPVPAVLKQAASEYAMKPQLLLEVSIARPNAPAEMFNVPSTVPTARSSDFSQVTIQDGTGRAVKAPDLSNALREAFAAALADGVKDRGLKVVAMNSPVTEGLRLRVSLRPRPEWGIVPEDPLNRTLPPGAELPRAAGVVVSGVVLVAGDRSVELVGSSPSVPLSVHSFDAASAVPSNIQIIVTPGQTNQVAGSVEYPGMDLLAPAREAGAWLADYLHSPDRDWDLIWVEEQAPVAEVQAAFRAVFALAGSRFVADTLIAYPQRMGPSAEAALLAFLSDGAMPSAWLRPFLDAPEPYRGTAAGTLDMKEQTASKIVMQLLLMDPASLDLKDLPPLAPDGLVDVCRQMEQNPSEDEEEEFDAYAALTRRYVMEERMGNVLIDPEIKGLAITPVSSQQRVADFLRAELIAADPKRAGGVFEEMLSLQRSWARLSAIQGILDVDYVDAAARLRDLNKELQEAPALGPVAMREIELLRPNITKIGRYELKTMALQTFISAGELDKAAGVVADIAREQPGTATALRAQELLDAARSAVPGP
jgi:hypothetical protein